MKALVAEREELNRKFTAKVLALLTPEQKSTWDQHQLVEQALRAFKGVTLTDEQTAKVKAKAAELAKGVDFAKDKPRQEATGKLRDYIEKDVLTDAQKAALKAAPSPAGDAQAIMPTKEGKQPRDAVQPREGK